MIEAPDQPAVQRQASPRLATASRLPTAPAPANGWRNVLITALLALLLLALILIPRLSDLDALVTPDEPLWVGRSANFYQALSSGNLKDTYQFVHPGVPVMWLGALSFRITMPELPDLLGGQINERNNDLREIVTPAGYNLSEMLFDLRVSIVIFSALVVIALFFCLIPLVGRWTSAAAIAMIALNPMHIGYTRLLHLDGLSANLLVLSVVAFCVYLQRRSRFFLLVSAIVTGIAVLTRSANGVLAPLVAMLAAVDIALTWWIQRGPVRPTLRRYALAILLWGGVALVTCVIIWPALWVAPIGTLRGMWSGGLDLATDPHSRQILFRGEVTEADPGWLYYPIVLIYRISPFSLIGMALAAVAALLPRSQGVILNRRLCFNLALFAGAYIVILSMAAKKLDRYMLPSLMALDLVALFGWVAFARWIADRLTLNDARLSRFAASALIGVVLIGQGTLALDARPYYLNAASPMVGGTAGASEQLSFGWGEGGKQVAEALETIPGVSESLVLAGPWPMSIDYYLPYRVKLPIYELTPRSADLWIDADYVVVAAPEIQRQLYPPAMIEWFNQQTPMMLVMDGGEVYARIFDLRDDVLPTPYYAAPEAEMSLWGDDILVAGRHLPGAVRQGRNAVISLYLQGTGAASEFLIDTEIVAADGSIVGTGTVSHQIAAGNTSLNFVECLVDLPDDLPPDLYTVRLTIRDASTEQPLPALRYATQESLTAPVSLGTIEVVILPEP